jgi:hypothetical protein
LEGRLTKITVAAMRDHIAALVKQHSLTVLEIRHPRDGSAYFDQCEIAIAPIKSAISYATALHEIGHLIVERQKLSRRFMVQEFAAWDWARKNALTWTPTMERVAKKSFQNYAAARQRPPFPR